MQSHDEPLHKDSKGANSRGATIYAEGIGAIPLFKKGRNKPKRQEDAGPEQEAVRSQLKKPPPQQEAKATKKCRKARRSVASGRKKGSHQLEVTRQDLLI